MSKRTPASIALDLIAGVGKAYEHDDSMRVALIPGAMVPDDWCWGGCGAVFVRLDQAYASTRFPTPDTSPTCTAPLAARFHVGVARCVAGMSDKGQPPSAEAQTEDALILLDDLTTLRCALRDVAAAYRGGEVLVGAWTPVGPVGDCAGGYWAVTIRV